MGLPANPDTLKIPVPIHTYKKNTNLQQQLGDLPPRKPSSLRLTVFPSSFHILSKAKRNNITQQECD